MNLTEAVKVLREFESDSEFDALDSTIRRAIRRMVSAHPAQKDPKPIPRLYSPEDSAWSRAIKRDATHCAVCGQPKDRGELEAMHCVSRREDSLRPGHDVHSVLGGCCLRHDRMNGAPGCHPCHRAIDYNATASEVFWRAWFTKQGYAHDHYDQLQEEGRRCSKVLPRREVAS